MYFIKQWSEGENEMIIPLTNNPRLQSSALIAAGLSIAGTALLAFVTMSLYWRKHYYYYSSRNLLGLIVMQRNTNTLLQELGKN